MSGVAPAAGSDEPEGTMPVDGFAACVEAFRTSAQLSPRAFFARRTLRESATNWYVDAAGFPTLMGARARPLAHQISAVLRVLSDRSQRFILADEVGLGKTIEAGAILQALWHHRPEMSVLVVAPGSMARQWWRELYLRFGARVFSCVDATTSAADLDRQFKQPWVVVSLTALQRRPDIRERVAVRNWEALVVDEAHHLDRLHPLYNFVHQLSARAKAALVLSATPSQRQIAGLAALLSLVAPDDYRADDVQLLERRIAARLETWRTIEEKSGLIEAAADEQNLTSEDLQELIEGWGEALGSDPTIRRWLGEARTLPPRKALKPLELAVAYARERWRLDRRIIRTRRRTLQFLEEKYSQRQLEAELTYSPSGGEASLAALLDGLPRQPTADGHALAQILLRLAATTPDQVRDFINRRLEALARGLPTGNGEFAAAWESHGGPAEEAALLAEAPGRCPRLLLPDGEREEDWLKRALDFVSAWEETDDNTPARHREVVHWIAERAVEDPTRRFLVFAQDVGTVTRFAATLARETQWKVSTFHHRMDDQSLDKAAEDFTVGATRVLVSDDLGGEGRNLQIAWAIVHLDVPVSPGRLEQRIGRVDRLGRSADQPVRSVTTIGPLEAEQFLHQAHRDVFRVYRESIGGLEFVVPQLVRQLREAMTGGEDPVATIGRLTAEVQAVWEEEDHAFQVGLDTSRAELHRAKDVADTLASDPDLNAAKSPHFWLQAVGVNVGPDGPARSRVSLSPDNLEVEEIPGVGRGFPSFQATWMRQDALRHERLQFLAPGHRLVDGAYQLLDSSNLGRAALLGRNLGRAGRDAIFAVALFVTDLPDVHLNLPAGLVARARAEVGRDTGTVYMRYDTEAHTWSELDGTTNARLIRDLDRQSFDPRGGDRDYSTGASVRLTELSLIGALERGLEAPYARLQEQAERVAEEAADRLLQLWRAEIAYFEALGDSGSQEEQLRAQEELRIRRDLLERVRALRPRLDGLMLVCAT